MSALRSATWHRSLFEGEATAARVEALLAAVPHSTLFNTVPWCEAAAAALPASRALHVLTVTDANGLAVWLPLSAGREHIHGVPVTTVRLLGHPFNDRVAVPMRSGDATLTGAVVDALRACPCRWDVLILSELHDAAERQLLAAAGAARPALGVDWRACSSTPVLWLDAAPSMAFARTGKAATQRVARARRKLAAAGRVRFERTLPEPADVPRWVALCKAIEDRSWKGSQRLGIFSNPADEAFFRDAGARLAARGWLDIGLLRVDAEPVSYRFGFRYRGAFLDFNLAFDPAFAACAPGRILLDDMIVSSRDEGLLAVDASRSSRAEPHLLADWTDARIEHHERWLFAPTPRGRLLGWARRRLRPWLQRWRATAHTPATEELACASA